jgi:hypothetical protein
MVFHTALSRRSLVAAGGTAGLLGLGGLGSLARGEARTGSTITVEPTAFRPMSEIIGFGVRKEAHGLTADSDDVRMYREAVGWMKARSEANPLDPLGWAQHWAHHSLFCATNTFNFQVHYGWFFLPWHRAYLVNLEQKIRRVLNEPGFGLPYWDWTRNPRIPAWYWGEDNPLNNPTRLQEPGDFMPGDFIELGPALRALDFSNFGGRKRVPGEFQVEGTLEQGAHNNTHNWTGGEMASFDGAGNDPMFQSHHGNIDRLWEIWLAQGEGRANPTDPEWLDHLFWFYGPTGEREAVRVGDLIDTRALGYAFENLDWRHTLTPYNTPRIEGYVSNYAALGLTTAELAAIRSLKEGTRIGRVSLNYERMTLPIQPFQHRLFFIDEPSGEATYVGTFTILPIPDLRAGLEKSVTSQVEVPPAALEILLKSGRVRVVGVGVPLKGRKIPTQPIPFEGVSLSIDA